MAAFFSRSPFGRRPNFVEPRRRRRGVQSAAGGRGFDMFRSRGIDVAGEIRFQAKPSLPSAALVWANCCDVMMGTLHLHFVQC